MELVNQEQELTFEVGDLADDLDITIYRSVLVELGDNNPFHSLELINAHQGVAGEAKFFLLSKSSRPVLVMPFFKSQIVINGSKHSYADISSPYGYTGPQFGNNVNSALYNYFWKSAESWQRQNNIVSEFIRFSLNGNHEHYPGSLVFNDNCVVGELDDFDSLWKSFKPKVRNNVRKARKAGCYVHIEYNPISSAAIESFYRIYTATMDRANADVRYYFTADLIGAFIDKNPQSCVVANTYLGTDAISTELCLLSGKTIYSFLGGTDSEYFSVRPNDLLKCELMKWGFEHGFRYYVLGGGRRANDSLYHYKKSFFHRENDISFITGRRIINRDVFSKLVGKSDHNTTAKSDFFSTLPKLITTTGQTCSASHIPHYTQCFNFPFSGLPVDVRGRSSKNTMSLGTIKDAIHCLQCDRMSSTLTLLFFLTTTNNRISSSPISPGTPTAAQS